MLRGASRLQSLFDRYIREDILLIVSGGSALELMQNYDIDNEKRFTLAILDARWSTDPEQNNFMKLEKRPLYDQLVSNGAKVIDSAPQGDEIRDEFWHRVERALKNWRIVHPQGIVIATMGMGPDGHTGGVFPYPEDPDFFARMFLSDRWMISYDAEGKHDMPYRVTTTLTYMQSQIDHAVAVIAGEEKQPAFDRVIAKEGDIAEKP